ncbi:hypothetical protein HDU81_005413 [Chytriomyces hyalinus]|nr:hypothetical protein HDU81_005413 [Chytriomyces hyalinus]
MSSTTASSKGGPMLGGTSESADDLLNELLFDTQQQPAQPLPVIQLDQTPLSVFDEDPQFALFAGSNARNRRASLPSELLSGLDGLSFGGEYGIDPMDPSLMMDPAMLELLGNGGADQGTVDPFDIFNLTPLDANPAGLGYNYNNSALSAGLSAGNNNNNSSSMANANTSAGSEPIPIPFDARIYSLKPPSYSDRTLSTSAPQTGSDFFTLFAKSFKTPPMALSTSFNNNNNLVIPSPEASPIAGRRSSFSNPSGTSPMLNRRPSLSNPNASGPLGNRRGSLSNPAGTQDAQHHMLHHPLQQQQHIESSILHKPRFSKFKSPSSPTLATFANQSLFTAPTATAAAPATGAVAAAGATAPMMQNMDTRPRDHVCSMCGNKFLRRQDLMRHEVTHSTVKQFTCLYGCGASFGRSDALGRHMKNGKCRAVGQQA